MNLPTLEDRFVALIRDHKKLIYKACHSYTTTKDDFKDLEQEIIVQLWKAFPRYNPAYKLSTWMYKIALNTAISFYRKEKRRPHHDRLEGHIVEMIADPASEQDAEGEQHIQALHGFIQNLGEMNKALMLLYLDGNSYAEIADVLGISETNVATKISRIKIMLKKHFSNL